MAMICENVLKIESFEGLVIQFFKDSFMCTEEFFSHGNWSNKL